MKHIKEHKCLITVTLFLVRAEFSISYLPKTHNLKLLFQLLDNALDNFQP